MSQRVSMRRKKRIPVSLSEEEMRQLELLKEKLGYYYKAEVLYRAFKEFLERHKELLNNGSERGDKL